MSSTPKTSQPRGVSPFQPTQRGKLSSALPTERSSLAPPAIRPHAISRVSHLCNALPFPYIVGRIHDRDSNGLSLADDIFGPQSAERYRSLPPESTAALKFLIAVAMNEGFHKAAELENSRLKALNTSPEPPRSSPDTPPMSAPPDPLFKDFVAIVSGKPRSYQGLFEEFLKEETTSDQKAVKLPDNLIPEEAVSFNKVYGMDLSRYIGESDHGRGTEQDIEVNRKSIKLDVSLIFDDSSKKVSIDWNEVLCDDTQGKPSSDSSDPLLKLMEPPDEKDMQFGIAENAPLTPLQVLLKSFDAHPQSSKKAKSEPGRHNKAVRDMERAVRRPKREVDDTDDEVRSPEPIDSDVITIADSDNEQHDVPSVKGKMKPKPAVHISSESAKTEKQSPLETRTSLGKRRSSLRISSRSLDASETTKPDQKKKMKREQKSDVSKNPLRKSEGGEQTKTEHPFKPISGQRVNKSSVKSGQNEDDGQAPADRTKSKRASQGFRSEQESSDDEEGEDVIERRLRENTRGRKVSFDLPQSQRKAQGEVKQPQTQKKQSQQQKQRQQQKQQKQPHQTKAKPVTHEESDDDVEFVSTKRSSRRQRATRSSKAVTESSDSDHRYRCEPDVEFKPVGKHSTRASSKVPDLSSDPPITPNVPSTNISAAEECLALSTVSNEFMNSLPPNTHSFVVDPTPIQSLLNPVNSSQTTQLPLTPLQLNQAMPEMTKLQLNSSLLNQTMHSQSTQLHMQLNNPMSQAMSCQIPQLLPNQGNLSSLQKNTATGSSLPGSLLKGTFTRRTSVTPSAASAGLIRLDDDCEQFMDQIVQSTTDGPSSASFLPSDSLNLEEGEVDRMLAAAGTGSPDLSDYEDAPEKRNMANAVQTTAVVRAVIGQIVEKKGDLKDCEHYEVDEDVSAFYRESRVVPQHAPDNLGGRSIGTQFMVEQQLSKDGPWAYRVNMSEEVNGQEDDVIIAQGGPVYSTHMNNNNMSMYEQSSRQARTNLERPYGDTAEAHSRQRSFRYGQTVKTPRKTMGGARTPRSTFATSSTLPVDLEVMDRTMTEGASSGHDGDDLEYDHEVTELDRGQGLEEVEQNGAHKLDHGDSEVIDGAEAVTGRHVTTRRGRSRQRSVEQQAVELQHRVCGSSWEGMADQVKNEVLRWARHDFSWFGEGRNFVELKAQQIPIPCKICEMKVSVDSDDNMCEKTVLIKLWRDMSWRKTQRVKHHVTTE